MVMMVLLHQCALLLLGKLAFVSCPALIEPRAADSLSVGGTVSIVVRWYHATVALQLSLHAL